MYWIIFHTDQLLLHDGALPQGEVPPLAIPEGAHVHTLPDLDGEPCRAFCISYEEIDSSSRSSEVQESGSSDNSFDSEECRRQECRSVDNSFDSEKQKESASSAQSASEKLVSDELQATSDEMQAALSSALLSEASLLHSCTPEKKTSCTPEKEISFVPLRASYDVLPLAHYLMAGKARELMHFDDTVRYCSVCGAPMRWNTDISKMCTSCQREVWPTIATAIIVRITRGDEVLLVRAKNFRGNYYGLVAGFLETGETLEECVRREVREETNLEVKDIRYFGNQPWPYPSGQMIGFTAHYAGGTLRIQDDELSTAAFFHRDHLPEIPHKLSMARMLIDDWLEGGSYE